MLNTSMWLQPCGGSRDAKQRFELTKAGEIIYAPLKKCATINWNEIGGDVERTHTLICISVSSWANRTHSSHPFTPEMAAVGNSVGVRWLAAPTVDIQQDGRNRALGAERDVPRCGRPQPLRPAAPRRRMDVPLRVVWAMLTVCVNV